MRKQYKKMLSNVLETLEPRALLSATLSVPATSDPWILGGLTGTGTGTAPPSVNLAAISGQTLTLSNVSGTVTRGLTNLSGGADGQNFLNVTDNISPVGGLSGIINNDADQDFALLAVFTGNTVPAGSPPATEDYSTVTAQSSFSPALDQVFFIGDGRTGTNAGATQQVTVPTGATKVSFGFADHAFSAPNNIPAGYADNTGSVKITVNVTAPASRGKITGTVFADTNLNGKQDSSEAGIAGATVYLDLNKNGKLDKGEPTVTTAANGTYGYSDVVPGTYQVREVLPAGATASTPQPVSVTVTAGSSTTVNFGDALNATISGTVFNDTNGNGTLDTGETGIAGVVVYIDANTNGVLDSFDAQTTSNSSGNYSFNVPFGTYTIREVVPAGDTLTSTIAPVTISASGKLTVNLGNKLS